MNKSMKKIFKYTAVSLTILIAISISLIIGQFPPITDSYDKTVHMSFDDVYEVLLDITANKNEYESVFDNEFLGSLEGMNDKYGAKFTLYIYDSYPEENYYISQVTDKYKQEFTENSNWLRFGYHTIEPTTSFDDETKIEEFEESFLKVNKEIARFAGEDSIANVLRLNYFRASSEKVEYLTEQGILGLLCSDDERISYDLSQEQHNKLKEEGKITYNGMSYYNTNFRFDGKRFITYEIMKLRNQENLVLFGHEWALGNKGLNRIESGVKWLVRNNYDFSFLE